MERDDLTLIAELGRAKRDVISGVIPTIQAFAQCNPDSYVQKKKTVFPGIGPETLSKLRARAQLLTVPGATAYLKEPVNLPINQKEVYFDIEADPMRGVVYLHGFVERKFGQAKTAKFIPYFADGNESVHEEAAFDLARGKRTPYGALRRYGRSSADGAFTEEGIHVRIQA